MRPAGRAFIGLLALVGALAVGGSVMLLRRGVSARQEPSRIETTGARTIRHWMIPSKERARVNPDAPSDQDIAPGRMHFADHCSSCHGNDGSGETPIGHGLYPPAPDMRRSETQDLSDGEIFWIIQNGVKMTGMPAWGTRSAEDERDSWHLVAFIRHLPRIAPAEIEMMKAMNPKTPQEMEEDRDIQNFLSGGRVPPNMEQMHSPDNQSTKEK
jgi:mono/diheme cytochrome c family protein